MENIGITLCLAALTFGMLFSAWMLNDVLTDIRNELRELRKLKNEKNS